MNTNEPQKKLSAQERRGLKIFFWFALITTLLLLWASPSKNTAFSVAVVVFFGYQLYFKKPDRDVVSLAPAADTTHWSKLSAWQGLFLILCTFATPLIFGVRSANIVYFILCWLGLFVGCASIITFKLIRDDQQKKYGNK